MYDILLHQRYSCWQCKIFTYLSISSPPVDAGGSNFSLSVLPSTAASDTFEGASLGCGSGIAYGVSATAEGPAAQKCSRYQKIN